MFGSSALVCLLSICSLISHVAILSRVLNFSCLVVLGGDELKPEDGWHCAVYNTSVLLSFKHTHALVLHPRVLHQWHYRQKGGWRCGGGLVVAALCQEDQSYVCTSRHFIPRPPAVLHATVLAASVAQAVRDACGWRGVEDGIEGGTVGTKGRTWRPWVSCTTTAC